MLSVEIRNTLAFKKLVRLTAKRLFHKETTKTWNFHVLDLSPIEFDFDETKTLLAKVMLSNRQALTIIDKLHRSHSGTILEDKEITLLFIKECHKELML